ncbi:hypothetical protein [Alsobacter sp. R-9]
MRSLRRVEDTEEARARARLLAHFEDYPESVFYSRQLEVLFEREYFHWITNRAIRRLVEEGRIVSETRRLAIGSEVKLLWNRKFRFHRRAASDVFAMVDRYSSAATDGTLGLQGEHLILAAFARGQYLLHGEGTNRFNGLQWDETNHDLDFIFEKSGSFYGVEVKNTLRYLDVQEFVIKVRMCRHLGIKPVFAVRALPKTWIEALIQAGGYAMIMSYQFYPWTHADLAREIRARLSLPVDTPRRIEEGTMLRFERWARKSVPVSADGAGTDRLLKRLAPERGLPQGRPDR